MTKTITITELLKDPNKIKEGVQKGFSFTVLFRKTPIFQINPISNPNTQPKQGFAERPTMKLNLPDKLTKRDIYEKYGAKNSSGH